jgi:hypothetical protein
MRSCLLVACAAKGTRRAACASSATLLLLLGALLALMTASTANAQKAQSLIADDAASTYSRKLVCLRLRVCGRAGRPSAGA